MEFRKPLVIVALAFALPAAAQSYSSSSSTVTNGATTTQSNVTSNGAATTSITGGTGDGTYSASGVVANPAQDQVLLRQVVTELANDPAMAGAQIDVQVVGGRVTLNGMALGPAQAESARTTAQNVAGAANVSSNLSTSRQ